jgi:hypothetical protein
VWRDQRQVIEGIGTGFGPAFGGVTCPWETVYERHRLSSAGGTWERLLEQGQSAADAAGEIDWDISVDFAIVRAHQHAAGACTDLPQRGIQPAEHQGETAWESLHARLAEVGTWAAHVAVCQQAPPERRCLLSLFAHQVSERTTSPNRPSDQQLRTSKSGDATLRHDQPECRNPHHTQTNDTGQPSSPLITHEVVGASAGHRLRDVRGRLSQREWVQARRIRQRSDDYGR